MHRCLVTATTVVCCLLANSVCSAGDLAERITIIHVKHKAQRYDVERWYGIRSERTDNIPLESRQRLNLRPGERVKIVIDDANKFLYKYSLTNGKATETANGAAAQTFTTNLFNVVNILDPPKKAARLNQEPRIGQPSGQIRFASFRQMDQDPQVDRPTRTESSQEVVLKGIERLDAVVLPSPSDGSDRTPAPEAASRYVAERMEIVNQTLQEIRENPVPSIGGGAVRKAFTNAGISDPGQFLHDLRGDIVKLILYLSQVNSQIQQVDEGKALAAQLTVASWSVPALSQKIQNSYSKIHAVNEALGARLGVVEEIRRSDELRDAISLRLAQAAAQQKDPDVKTIVKDALKKEREDNDDKIAALESIISRLTSELTDAQKADVKTINELEEANKKLAELARRKLRLDAFNEQITTLGSLITDLPGDPYSLNLDLLRPYERDVRDSLKELEAFAASMLDVHKEEAMGTAEYSGLVTPKILTVELAQNAPKDVKPTRALKEYTFAFQPYSGVTLEPGAGVVFSFVEKHTFSATRDAEGRLIVTDTASGDYTGAKGAFMLAIIPNKWAESDFHGLFEIGARPDSNVGLYAGAGIKMNNYFSAGAGVAFEQIDELKAGLKPGDEITSADQLKTQKRFKSGLYLHITFSTKLGGGS